MKKVQLIAFGISLLFLLIACGGATEKKETQEESKPAKTEKLDLKTEEGVVKTLKNVGIEIPSEFKFENAELDGGYYKSEFTTDSLDEETFTELGSWLPELVEKKVEEGWKKFEVREDERWADVMVINETILYPPKNEEIKTVTISSSADEEKMVISLNFNIDR